MEESLQENGFYSELLLSSERVKRRCQMKIDRFFFSGVSFNLPQLSLNATWNPNATTFADVSTVGTFVYGIFVNTNNTVYISSYTFNEVQIWPEGSHGSVRNISAGLLNPFNIFVTSNGDIYVDNGRVNHQVDKWIPNATSGINVMNVSHACTGLFIDNNNTLYCSVETDHRVWKRSLNHATVLTVDVIGNGSAGSASDMLHEPHGVFVDHNFDLYVADFRNNRIQVFAVNERNGTTVVGAGASRPLHPAGVTLDGNGLIYIADTDNNRIIGPGPSGYRCLAGCSNSAGSSSSQLRLPQTISFDTYGNMFVTDYWNGRVQKFLLETGYTGTYFLNCTLIEALD
jgi:NHL repeat